MEELVGVAWTPFIALANLDILEKSAKVCFRKEEINSDFSFTDEFVIETITNADGFNKDNELELEMPIAIHLDHVHNLYIAAGTLACAFVIVILIVGLLRCNELNKLNKLLYFIGNSLPLPR